MTDTDCCDSLPPGCYRLSVSAVETTIFSERLENNHSSPYDAFVHVIVEPSALSRTADAIADGDSVSEVHLVTGEYDVVAQLDVGSKDDIADAVTGDILPVSGVVETVTNVAFEP